MSIPATSGTTAPTQEPAQSRPTIAFVGSPNTGKTTLFNALTGLRAQTANFAGTTVEKRTGVVAFGNQTAELIDLPGVYSLNAATPEEKITCDALRGKLVDVPPASVIIALVDADNLERSLFVASQLLELDRPVIIALNMVDIAKRHGLHIDATALERELGCPVVPLVARTGEGLQALRDTIGKCLRGETAERIPLLNPVAHCGACASCPFQTRYNWSDVVSARCVKSTRVARDSQTERLDRLLTHPVAGIATFLAVMLSIFYMIFSVASVPMDMIDGLFAGLGQWVAQRVPDGDFRSFLVDGIIGGVGGILVFLPQICILFFALALLDDSGYLARAAFVMDKLMRRIGLPGTAFVPLLSAHACAIPAIMATRVIRDPRDRLVTILVTPLMTCSARIPVYAMIAALLFPDDPLRASLLFTGAYGLGICASLTMAFLFKKTILPGERKPLVLELPSYRIPVLRTAFRYTYERAKVFITQAGTFILVISMIMWVLSTYPKTNPELTAGLTEAEQASVELSNSIAGRLGKIIEPVVKPLGFDWQIGIGVITSFAAREVIVSTLSIVYGLGHDAEEKSESLYARLREAVHPDGTAVFTVATSASLLVFYILAMQCLPTLAATRRETNSWKWPVFQLVYMSLLAYGGAFLTYQSLRLIGL